MSYREWDCTLAGRLAEDWEVSGRSAVFINSQDSIQFSIKVMSDSPPDIAEIEHFTSWGDRLPDFHDDHIALPEERIDALKEYLEGKIILFKPVLKVNSSNNERYNQAEPIAVLEAPGGIGADDRLIPLLNIPDIELEEFEGRLLSRRLVVPYQKTFPRDMPVVEPSCVVIGTWLYGPLERMQPVLGGWSLMGKDVRKFQVKWGEYDTLVLPFRNIIFVEGQTYFQVLTEMLMNEGIAVRAKTADSTTEVSLESGQSPGKDTSKDASGARVPNEQTSPALAEDSREVPVPTARFESSGKGTQVPPGFAEAAPTSEGDTATVQISTAVASLRGVGGPPSAEDMLVDPPDVRIPPAEAVQSKSVELVSEAGFLDRLRRVAQKKRLFYDENDLINFHTAMKTGSLVLLSGMSGTGKTRLVQVYAEALGLEMGSQFRIVPIRPTWTDGSDLLGFLDLTHNLYRPSEAGLVELLVDAQKNPDKMYLVCFDEMNLARVEHYFSQFISVLELDPQHRYIELYSAADAGRVYNAHQYPHRVRVGDNVMFVGTVNVDESTYAFSDKVLDRAQVIRPQVLPFSSLRVHLEQRVAELEPVVFSFTTYNGWRVDGGELKLSSAELEFLESMHEELQSVEQQLGIGYRTLRQIDVYLQNIPVDDDGRQIVERSIAFDWQVVQKIFTKLRGPREQLERLIGTINEDGEISGSSLIRLMDDNERLSSFAASRTAIEQKARELSTYGYAS